VSRPITHTDLRRPRDGLKPLLSALLAIVLWPLLLLGVNLHIK
jgi:hypothetical protein